MARDCIKRLLEKDKTKRLGAKDDVNEILAHPFFDGLSIEALLKKEIVPTYKPEITDDLKFFDKNLTGMDSVKESVIDKSRQKYILQNQHIFKGL